MAMTDWPVFFADLMIAAVIYYEVEHTRAATFLANASEEAYRAREEIYDAYALTPGGTYREKTTTFCQRLQTEKDLRRKVERQLIEFSRAQYLLRWSLFHHDLMVKWFPHVIVRLWIVLEPYIREKQKGRPKWQWTWPRLVGKSLRRLEGDGLAPITIFSSDGKSTVTISVDELQAIKARLNNSAV